MRKKRVKIRMQRVGGRCEPMVGDTYTGLGAARLNGTGLLGGTGIARYSGAQLLDCGEVAGISAKRVVPQGFCALSLSVEETGLFFLPQKSNEFFLC